MRELGRVPGRPGKDVVIGLDAVMQDFMTRRCGAEASVACVLLDAVNGDILALVSSPSFDPALFSTGLTPAMWQLLSTDARNPLIQQGDRRRLSTGVDVQAGGRAGGPGRRSAHPGDRGILPGASRRLATPRSTAGARAATARSV